ncbi:LysE family translocator [Sphaerothrix gracilis]|uniref:LysE family translocator n=1 Tax=Sphaerothrix gracilis TaxID=3151835 RepID=UPI0031FE2D53
MPLLLQGLLLGLSIAAPVGPIGILCIRRTLVLGRLSGLVSGLGAATADGLYGCIAGFGLTFLTQFLVSQTLWLRLVGGLFLIYLGAKIFVSRPATDAAAIAPQSTLLGAYLSTLGLTLTNPATILSFVAIFAGLGLAEGDRSYLDSSVLVLGVFFGSALWWWLLSWSVNLFRARFDLQRLRWLNRISGLMMAAFGVVALGWR